MGFLHSTSFSLFSICTLIAACFFLTLSVFLFSMKGKSRATLLLSIVLILMSVFFSGYFIGVSFDHPFAAYYRFIVITAIFGYSSVIILFFFTYPKKSHSLISKLIVTTVAAAGIMLTSWYTMHTLTSHASPVFNFESQSWEFPTSSSDIAVSAGILAMAVSFTIISLIRVLRFKSPQKGAMVAFVLIIMGITSISSVMNILSKYGLLSRGTFFLSQDFLNFAAYFAATTIYLNTTKDRSSFMTKIIGICGMTFLLIFQLLAFIAVNNHDKAYDRFRISDITAAAYTGIHPEGMKYLTRTSFPGDGTMAGPDTKTAKSWVYEQIQKAQCGISKKDLDGFFFRAGMKGSGFAAAAESFIAAGNGKVSATELTAFLDRMSRHARMLSRNIAFLPDANFHSTAVQLILESSTKETFVMDTIFAESVTASELNGQACRKFILEMIEPMEAAGTRTFVQTATGERYTEYMVMLSDNSIVRAGFDYGDYRRYLHPMVTEYIVVLLVVFTMILFGFRFFFFSAITRPLKLIENGIRRVHSGDLHVQVPVVVEDEIGLIAETFNSMTRQIAGAEAHLEAKVRTRTVQLEQANSELGKTISLLKETQNDLIRREKMAALGDMVAGIAHEINTPVGVALTAGSFLATKTAEIRKLADEGTLSRSAFDEYVRSASDSSRIITANIARAAELVTSFKKVAVAQTSGEACEFKVAQYMRDFLLNMRPALKKTKIRVVVECDEDLIIEGYPGALSQICTNLVMNSINHGFESEEPGIISITVQEKDRMLTLEYRDNGKGMSEDTLLRVFDPFFTTARHKGGTGLGMHIVYNIVTQKLGGTITVESTPGQGVMFRISVPLAVEKEFRERGDASDSE